MNTNQRKKRRIGFYLRVLVSFALIFFVFYKAGLTGLIETLKSTDFFFLGLVFAITPVLIFLSAWKWQILLSAQGIKVSLGKLVVLYLVGIFFNNIMPSSVGGDVIRAYELGKYTHKKAVSMASIFVERFTGLTVLIFLALIAFLVKMGSIGDARLTIIIGIAVVGYVSVFLLILDQRVIIFIQKKNKVRFIKKLMDKLQKVQSAIMDYKGKNRALWIAMIISFFFYIVAVVNVYVGCLAFGVHMPLAELFVGVPIILAISMIPITIGGIGLTEWAYFFIFTKLGDAGSLGLSVALLMRTKTVVLGLLGGVFYLSMTKKAVTKELRELSSDEERDHFSAFEVILKNTKQSQLEKYQEIVIGDKRLLNLIKYEVLTLLFGQIPGLIGLFLRRVFYMTLFKKIGAGVIIGCNVSFRHTGKISLGNRTVIDEYCTLRVQGDENSGITIGNDVLIGRDTVVTARDGTIEIGDHANISANCRIASTGKMVIGQHVLIAAYCYIGGANHRIDRIDIPIIQQGIVRKGGVSIGDDVWIGADVKINDGVKIGTGAVIGAGSVVTKDIPEYSIAYGVPAKVRDWRK
ncbi:Acetyltransferase [Methanophagales archaeon]|nr:Acetyltransferase [Methanophagales archaeon]